MLRRCLIVLVLLTALGGGTGFAQTKDPPSCDIKSKAKELHDTHAVPDFRGCDVNDAVKVLIAQDYRALGETDTNVVGIERGIVTHQRVEPYPAPIAQGTAGYPIRPKLVHLFAATGKGFPPSAPTSESAADKPPLPPDSPKFTDTSPVNETSNALQQYELRSIGIPFHGRPLRFGVSRTDPSPAANLQYDLIEGATAASGERTLPFGRGVREQTIVMRPGEYDICAQTVTVRLIVRPGDEVTRSVAPEGPIPAQCKTGLPLWPWIAGAIVTAIGLLWLGFKINHWRKQRERGDDPYDPHVIPTVTATCAIVTDSFDNGSPPQLPAPRWPTFTTQVTLDPGATSVPDPLPITERTDD